MFHAVYKFYITKLLFQRNSVACCKRNIHRMTEKTTVGGIPVECFTGEAAAVWSGWRTLGDRELVREASAKGTHISLAYKCLAFRRNSSIEDVQHYFNKEIESWVIELLKKRQIYRASHILNNMVY